MKWSEYPEEMRNKLRADGARSWEKNNINHANGINPDAYILGYTAARVELTSTPLITPEFLLSKGWKRRSRVDFELNDFDLNFMQADGWGADSIEKAGMISIYTYQEVVFSGKIPTESQYEVLNQLLELHGEPQ